MMTKKTKFCGDVLSSVQIITSLSVTDWVPQSLVCRMYIRSCPWISICGRKQVWAEGEVDCDAGLTAASAYWEFWS